MPKRTANHSIQVYRDGKIKTVKSGQTFNFTAEELADIKRVSPDAVRAPVNEEVEEDPQVKADREAKERQALALADARDKAESDLTAARNAVAVAQATADKPRATAADKKALEKAKADLEAAEKAFKESTTGASADDTSEL